MAARNEEASSIHNNAAPSSLKTRPNTKLGTIHEDESIPRRRKRDLIAGVWQETASRTPNIGSDGAIHPSEHPHATQDATIAKEEPQWTSSIQSGVRESIQTSFGFVTGPLALITAPIKSMPISIPFLRRQTPPSPQEESTEIPKEPRLHRFRPFAQSEHNTRQRLGMTRQFSVMPKNMSIRELNATLLVPVSQQSSWDIAALLLSYCSTGFETGTAVILFLIPSNIMRKWWNFLATSWPMKFLRGYWLWMVHVLHSGRRHAHTGSVQQTGSIFAAGAVLAAFNNASMQASYPPRTSDGGTRRRSKWRKK